MRRWNVKRLVNALRGRAPAVLVVCSGNTCRSPMGEWLIRDRFAVGPVWSRGTGVWGSGPMADPAIQTLVRLGFARASLDNHRSAPVLVSDLARADVVIAMTPGHAAQIHQLAQRLPWWTRPDLVTLDVPDPFGRDEAEYAYTADRILGQTYDRAGLRRKD